MGKCYSRGKLDTKTNNPTNKQSQMKVSPIQPTASIHLMLESLELGTGTSRLDQCSRFVINYLVGVAKSLHFSASQCPHF